MRTVCDYIRNKPSKKDDVYEAISQLFNDKCLQAYVFDDYMNGLFIAIFVLLIVSSIVSAIYSLQ